MSILSDLSAVPKCQISSIRLTWGALWKSLGAIPYLMVQKFQSQDLESIFVSNSPQSIMQARIRNHCCANPLSVCIYRNIGELWLLPACINSGSRWRAGQLSSVEMPGTMKPNTRCSSICEVTSSKFSGH